MKTNLIKLLFVASIMCTTLSYTACTKTAEEGKADFPAACGGYTDYRTITDEDAALFSSVYTTEPVLTPYAVATQVVAGTNYRFLCRDNAKQEYVVTIFVPLPCYADTQQAHVTNIQSPTPQE